MILGISSAWLLPTTSWAAKPVMLASPGHPPLARLEKKTGGRLGVALLDTGTGAITGHRLHERFGMCSTFKLPLAAAILRKVDEGSLRLDQWVPFSQADIVTAYFETRVAHGGRLRDEDQAVLAQVGRIAAEWVLSARLIAANRPCKAADKPASAIKRADGWLTSGC